MTDHLHHHHHAGHPHPPAYAGPSILRLSVWRRLAVAGAASAIVWAAVLWALA